MMWNNGAKGILLITLIVAGVGPATHAQSLPWDTFVDTESSSVCDVVNAENLELVVSTDSLTGIDNLVIVTGVDVRLADTEVLENGDVLYLGESAGFITFAEDGDGYRTLWWVGFGDRVVHVDEFTGEPTVTDFYPEDFVDVPCDACPLWDDPTVCEVPVTPDPGPTPGAPPVSISLCGTNTVVAMVATFIGLLGTGLIRRR